MKMKERTFKIAMPAWVKMDNMAALTLIVVCLLTKAFSPIAGLAVAILVIYTTAVPILVANGKFGFIPKDFNDEIDDITNMIMPFNPAAESDTAVQIIMLCIAIGFLLFTGQILLTIFLAATCFLSYKWYGNFMKK